MAECCTVVGCDLGIQWTHEERIPKESKTKYEPVPAEPTNAPDRLLGPFAAAVAQNETPPIGRLVDGAEAEDLRSMCTELLRAIDASCRDQEWDRLARLFMD